MKECDVTWLYGPLQSARDYYITTAPSEPQSILSKTNSFLSKKPILKKRSMSEVMLQNSLSTSSLIRQAASAVQAQQHDRNASFTHLPPEILEVLSPKPSSREATDYFSSQSTSGLQTPSEHSERRHIRFDDKVEQCIAVEIKDGEYEEEEEMKTSRSITDEDSDSSDEGVIMMKSTRRRPSINRHASSRRPSNSDNSKIIAKLPSTRLKDRLDSPQLLPASSHHLSSRPWRDGDISPSSSIETLRPYDPTKNFILPDDDPVWNQGQTFDDGENEHQNLGHQSAVIEPESSGLRRTASGMMMPIDDTDPAGAGLVGRVLDTVNTAKDIAHVIWNVGWRR